MQPSPSHILTDLEFSLLSFLDRPRAVRMVPLASIQAEFADHEYRAIRSSLTQLHDRGLVATDAFRSAWTTTTTGEQEVIAQNTRVELLSESSVA